MKSLQEQAEAMLETIDASDANRKHSKLTPMDRALIFRLHAKGNLQQQEIARAVGCDPATVSRTLKLLDTTKEAAVILKSGAAKLAQTVVDTDDPAIALKALGKLDVVRDDGAGHSIGAGIVINIGMPGKPLDLPVIDVTPKPPTTPLDAA